MNDSRSNTPRSGDRPSLDALNRTIEGLEARIGDLMSGAGQGGRQSPPAPGRQVPEALNQVSEILNRQRSLEQDRHPQAATPAVSPAASLADQVRERLRMPGISQPARTPAPHSQQTHAAAAPAVRPATAVPGNAFDIAEALVNLRSDLKRDLTQSFTQEIAELRQEIRSIGGAASEQGFATEIHSDLQRLADGIERLGQTNDHSAVRSLQGEFDSLRSLLGGLASHDDIEAFARQMPTSQTAAFDSGAIRDEILQLASRIDGLKAQLVNVNAEPALRALEEKLVMIAEAIEMFAAQAPDHGNTLSPQIEALDRRLDDITAAIEANSQAAHFSGDAGMASLEDRISRLTSQIDGIAIPKWENNIATRIESLTQRIEELGYSQTAARLEQRLDELAHMLDNPQQPAPQPELTGFLSDISRKIDALDHNSVSDQLIERFDLLARRIDELETAASMPASGLQHDDAFMRLEERMMDIAARLDEAAQPRDPHTADLSALEAQIANLSALLSQPQVAGAAAPDMSAFDQRMASLEDYMSTNDEYIVEAARQAAENALEAYARNYSGHASSGGAGIAPADLSVISDLAADLRALEELTRAGETRNQQTFEALQDTLVHIAERLDRMGQPAEAMAAPAMSAMSAQAATAAPAMPSTHDFDMPLEPAVFGRAAPASAPAAAQASVQAPRMPTSGYMLDPADSPESAYIDGYRDGTIIAEPIDPPEEEEVKPESKSLFVALGKKLIPGRKDSGTMPPRKVIEPAPGLDAADTISPELANQLLEPGSGAPDIHKILQKVRASQDAQGSGSSRSTQSETDNADYIAAARRAAQAAAAEMMPAASDEEEAGKAGGFARYRRPLLLAVGAVLLAVMAYPLANTLLGRSHAPAGVKPAAIVNSDNGAANKVPTLPPADTMTNAPAAPAAGAATDQAPQNAAPEVAPPAAEPPAAAPPAEPAKPAAQMEAPSEAPMAATAATESLAVPEGMGPQPLVDAAKQNDPLALFEVGSRLAEGRGVTADPAAARAWFEKAAGLGFAPANYRLGNIYEKGIGVHTDIQKAMDYYLAAAKAGNVSAMHNLAVLFATGTAGAPDFRSAAKWFADAANHGVHDSQFNLAILYAKGSGVEQNLEQSYKWFGIAAKEGDQDAAQKRDEVAKALNEEQLKSAKSAVDSWSVSPPDENANSTIVPDAWAGKPQKTSSIDMKKAIRNIQAILDKNGFDAGAPDGVMGAKTVAAIKSFQKSVGQAPTGEIDEALVRELLARNKNGA